MPFAILTEHTFGVKSVAFSPCSQFLASIGTINDGCLHIWSMPGAKGGPVKLHSSNRCTNIVHDMAWIGKGLITVGLRHVKIWKMEEEPAVPSPQANSKSLHMIFEKFSHGKSKQPIRSQGPNVLNGRNALLGPLLDETFISVTAISDGRAIIATEKGDICVIDDGLQRVSKVASADSGVTCLAVDTQRKFAWVACKQGTIRTLKLQDIANPLTPPESPSSRSGSPILPLGCKPANVIAMAAMGQNLFLIDTNRSIKVVSLKYHEGLPTPDSVAYEFPAHKSAVNGVRLMPPSAHIQADFFTWSACGTVLFWDNHGNSQNELVVELEQPKDAEEDGKNELKVVEFSGTGELIVTGDKVGVLRVIHASDRSSNYVVKAHSGEIMSISIHEGQKFTIISSCARDRTVQLFTKKKRPGSVWTLTQTLDEHTASVTGVMFMDDGTKLLSASADRTIVVRELAVKEKDNGEIDMLAYLAARTITLKATPLHMAMFNENSPLLLTSTTGRQVFRFDITTGRELHCFKCTDENGESVILDTVTPGRDVTFGKGKLMAGISSTDKSVRIYDMAGNLVEREWGHTEGVTDVAMFETSRSGEDGTRLTLISTGTDGTVMIWSYNSKLIGDGDSADGISISDTTASKAPIRKVLSKAEIMELTTGKGSDAASIASGKTNYKENRKDSLLGADWASSSEVETISPTPTPSTLRKVENSPVASNPEPTNIPATAVPTTATTNNTVPAARSRLTERPKSAIISTSPPKPPPKGSHRNSVAGIPKSGTTSTTNLATPTKGDNASRAPSRGSRTTSRTDTTRSSHTDTETSSSTGTVKRKLRLPTRPRDPSPSTMASSKNSKSASSGAGGLLASRRGSNSNSSRTSSIRTSGASGAAAHSNSSRETSSEIANANALSEQMTRSLGVFRRRVESTQYAIKPEVRKELEKELLATLKCIGCPVPSAVTPIVSISGDEGALSPRSLANGGPAYTYGSGPADGLGLRMDDQMMALVTTYSERLLSVVQNSLPELASPRPNLSGPRPGR